MKGDDKTAVSGWLEVDKMVHLSTVPKMASCPLLVTGHGVTSHGDLKVGDEINPITGHRGRSALDWHGLKYTNLPDFKRLIVLARFTA